MLPLYASCDYAYFRPRQSPSRAERLIHHVVENTWCEPSFSDQIVQRTSLNIHTLSSKRPNCNNINCLLNFETVEDDKDSLHCLRSDEDMLKLVFSDTLNERSIPNLILPHIKCNMIAIKSAATLLEERGLLNFMEESAAHNEIQLLSPVLDPLACVECDMIRYAPMTHDTVDVFRALQSELANTYTGVFSHHAYIETIPLLCHPELHMNETRQHQDLATQHLEHLLYPKPVATPVLLFNCKGFNVTDYLLGESAERARTSQFYKSSRPAVGAENLNTEVAEQEQWQQLLYPCTNLPAVTFYGDVGEVLPNFATESAPSHSLANSSSAHHNGYNSATMGPNAVQAVLAQIQRTHTPSMTRAVAHSNNNSGSDQKRVFMYSPPLLAHFAGSIQRLIDLQSPWQLMPCQPNRKWHRAGHNNTQAVHSQHTSDVVVALEAGFKPLCRIVPVLRASPVHSRALRSPVLDEGVDGAGGADVNDKNKNLKDKRTINEMQEFVETASLNAIPDQDEEESVEVEGDAAPVSAKRFHEGEEDGEYKKRRVEQHNGDSPSETTDGGTLNLRPTAAPQAQIRDVELAVDPSDPFPNRDGADDARKHISPRRPVASNADPPLAAHVQLAILPVLPAVDSHPTTFVHRAPSSTPPSPPTRRDSAPSNESTEAEVPSFHLPSFDFNFDLNANGEGGLVEQYLRLQRGESASVPTRGAPTGSRAAHASSVSRTTGPMNHYVTPQRPPSHTTGEAQASFSAGDRVSAGAPTSRLVGSVAQVTPAHSSTRVASATAITDRDAVHLRVQQLAAHNVIIFRATDHPLTVLISEAFLEQYFTQVAEGLGTMGVVMLDCPLQEPVSLILDAFTAVCVVRAELLQNTTELKVLVKKLSEITFKFTKIHVIVVLEATKATQEKQLNKALLTLTQAVSRFPAAVCLRQCAASPAALVAELEQLCSQSLRDAAMHLVSTGTTARHFHRPFLDHLQHCDAKHLAHCEYLQLFPTLNFYTAAALLHHHPLRELVGQRAGVLCDLFAKQYVPCEEVKDMVKSFVALLEAHAGLQLGADVV